MDSLKNKLMEQTELAALEHKISYEFKETDFLEEALRHSSFVNEQGDKDLRDNERLEFLGDAVLNLAVGHILMQRYPNSKEGELSRMRANLVNESKLASIARAMDLGSHIRLGKGELQTNGHSKKSILGDAFEALIAAVYLDGGFEAALKLVEDHFSDLLDTSSIDFKSQLQELLQGTLNVTPVYSVVQESGPDHDKTFRVCLNVRDLQIEGIGKSKKKAEQDAARKALEILR
jgi:ribonuclease-3